MSSLRDENSLNELKYFSFSVKHILASESDEKVTRRKMQIGFSLSKIALNPTNLDNSFQNWIIPFRIRKYCPKLDIKLHDIVRNRTIVSTIGHLHVLKTGNTSFCVLIRSDIKLEKMLLRGKDRGTVQIFARQKNKLASSPQYICRCFLPIIFT